MSLEKTIAENGKWRHMKARSKSDYSTVDQTNNWIKQTAFVAFLHYEKSTDIKVVEDSYYNGNMIICLNKDGNNMNSLKEAKQWNTNRFY